MLNISNNSVHSKINKNDFSTLNLVENKTSKKVIIRLIYGTIILLILILLLPWTQNIRSNGKVITLKPDQRPQTIQSIIGGRIEKWYVQEGDYVKKGDTILFISETKDLYLDNELLNRTKEQLDYKSLSVDSYNEKISALDNQISALTNEKELKLEQGRNKLKQAELKVQSDSINYQNALINFQTANEQYIRMKELYEKGLKSLTELENRNLTMQKTKAAEIEALNKLLTSKNEEINAKVEISSIRTKYESDIAKAKSEKFTALSDRLDTESTVSKMKNQFANYTIRNGMYYILAPQEGYITKLIQSGIGETIKEGAEIVSIMPINYDLAVELYIRPIDLPLLKIGQEVRIQFDGWPAIIFSGWPNASYGTYGGKVYAIDNFIGENGKFRVLVQPDPYDNPWPDALRFGGGTNNMILLSDVPIWYELWRNINGFPPDYYSAEEMNAKMNKQK